MRMPPFVLLLCLVFLAPSAARTEEVAFPTDRLDIRTQRDTLHFTVEVATSDEQHERGLMFRKSLPDLHGMIFIFPAAQRVAFWMKNTLIPLDMLFVDDRGNITQIARNARPESTDLIPSSQEVRAVIEIAGGAAAQYHIAPGDRVVYSLFP
jgi:uncharacterized membrane protein (UPF0127 family)